MINIYRIDHISQVVQELDKMGDLLESLFGCQKIRSWIDETEQCQGMTLTIPGTHGTCWELLAPLTDEAELSEFLRGPRGPGLHHVGVEVTDIAATRDMLERLGASYLEAPDERYIDALFGPPDGPTGLMFRLFGTPHIEPCGRQGTKFDLQPQVGASHLGIDGLLHVCQAHSDRDALTGWYEHAVGMREIYRTPDGAWPDMSTLMLSVPGSQLIWEVIQPEGEDSHVQRFLDRKGAGCHHLTFQIRDVAQAVQACEQHEVPTFGLNDGQTDGFSWCDFFIHPKHTGGILIQLYWEEHPGVWARSDKIPAAASNKPANELTR